jgi:hypothetical protein
MWLYLWHAYLRPIDNWCVTFTFDRHAATFLTFMPISCCMLVHDQFSQLSSQQQHIGNWCVVFTFRWLVLVFIIGVGTQSLLAVPEVLQGPFPVYHCRLVPVRSSVLPYSPFWAHVSCCPRLWGSRTHPFGDESAIRPTLLACQFLAFTTAPFFFLLCSQASSQSLINSATQSQPSAHR